MADLVITLLFYAFALAGSVTLGYVALRLTYPDVRTMEHGQKLGLSAATGAGMFILALVINAIAFNLDQTLSLTTPTFLTNAVILLLTIVTLKAYFTFINPQKYVTVAVPLPVAPTAQTTFDQRNNRNVGNARSATSKPMSIITDIEAQTAPKSQLERLARSATEGTTVIDVPIRREETTPAQLPKFEMIIPSKGDKIEVPKPASATGAKASTSEYVSMASPQANAQSETPWWRRKRDSTTAVPTVQTEKKQEKKPETKPTIATTAPVATGENWRRSRGDSASRAATMEKSEVDAILADVVKETKTKASVSQQSGGPVHRRYLLGKDAVQVIAPQGTANNTEFNTMIQDVYNQLKTAKETSTATPATQVNAKTDAKQNDKKEQKAPAKPAAGTNAPTSKNELSIQDILGGATPNSDSIQSTGVFAQLDAANPGEGTSLFGQLAEISGGKSTAAKAAASAPAKQPDVQNVKIAAEKDMACPTCRAKNTRIVFCPYCGSGMCANCSPQIKPMGPGQFTYTCPKCGEEINVKTR